MKWPFFKQKKQEEHDRYWQDKQIFRFNNLFENKKLVAAAFAGLTLVELLLLNYCLHVVTQLFSSLIKSSYAVDYSVLQAFRFSKAYFWIYVVALLAFSAMNAMSCVRYIFSFKEYNIGQKGSQRWTTLKEIQEQYKEIPEKTESYAGNPGIIVSRYQDKLYIDDSPVNNLIIGMTRSGKGEMEIFPMIDSFSRSEKKPSMIVTDPKIELFPASYETLKKRGYIPLLLNLVDPVNGMGFNPLQLIIDAAKRGDTDEAELLTFSLATSLCKKADEMGGDNAFFVEAATQLLSALIIANVEDCIKAGQENTNKVNIYSIITMFNELATAQVDQKTTALDLYFNRRPAMDRAKMLFASTGIAGDRTKGSVYATVFSKLLNMSISKNAKLLAESSLDLANIGFGEKPYAIFIGIPDFDKSNHFLASIFINQLYFVLAKRATFAGGKCKREVHFMLDEFGNLPAIDDMANKITVCLGRNIRFHLFIQSYSQLKSTYGAEAAETIEDNCGNQIYILTSNGDSAKKYSGLINNATIKDVSRNGKKFSSSKQYTENYIERPLLNAAELLNLRPGECVVVRSIKRTDLKGNPITSYPIYNRGETKFKYRYQYLLEDFPSGKSFLEYIPEMETRSHINLASRVVDTEQYLYDIFLAEAKKLQVSMLMQVDPNLYDELRNHFEHLESKVFENNASVGQVLDELIRFREEEKMNEETFADYEQRVKETCLRLYGR